MNSPRREFLKLATGASALLVVSRTAWTQAYPTRPVRWVVGFAPAGGAGNYVVFRNLTTASFTLTATPGTGPTLPPAPTRTSQRSLTAPPLGHRRAEA